MSSITLRTIIVDDEQSAIETLVGLLKSCCPEVEIVDTFSDPVEAMKAIPQHRPDLLFLDIQMPKVNGLEMLGIIGENRLQVIYVTGHEKFAIQALRLHAADYLLKPLSPEPLRAAVSEVARRFKAGQVSASPDEVQPKDYLRVPQQEGFRMLYVPDIVRLEADNAYTTIFMRDGYALVVSRGIREFDAWLPQKSFVRVHQSHIVNLRFVHTFSLSDGGRVGLRNGDEVPVSRRRMKYLRDQLDQWSEKLG